MLTLGRLGRKERIVTGTDWGRTLTEGEIRSTKYC